MAFHPYPQLIPSVFNLSGFGPPRRLTGASTWPWVDHSASGLDPATMGALFGLAFATASPHGLTSPLSTNSQAHSSKGTPSPHKEGSDGLYAHGFRIYFTPLPGYFSPFPHGTCPLSVTREYLGLAGGPARFVRDFSGPVLLGNTNTRVPVVSATGVSPSMPGPSKPSAYNKNFLLQPSPVELRIGSHDPERATTTVYHTRPV